MLRVKEYKFTEEHKKHLSETHKGPRPWMVGKYRLEESKRKMSEVQKGKHHSENTKLRMSQKKLGIKNPNWKGGINFEPYTIDWTETLKRSIRERDHYVCRLCGEPQGSIPLHVHHIDYNKKNCNPDNLISLCLSCHGKTNFNREYWKQYFQGLINF